MQHLRNPANRACFRRKHEAGCMHRLTITLSCSGSCERPARRHVISARRLPSLRVFDPSARRDRMHTPDYLFELCVSCLSCLCPAGRSARCGRRACREVERRASHRRLATVGDLYAAEENGRPLPILVRAESLFRVQASLMGWLFAYTDKSLK